MFVPFALGRFTVIGKIRYGGMAEVLKAQSVSDEGEIRTWAVKRPLPTIAEDPELLNLFWRETELLQVLSHKAFPKVEEVGVTRGLPYMVMEYVAGATVTDILQWERGSGLKVRPEAWVYMASELASAAEYLHRVRKGPARLVHGDIRASNVMVTEEGGVKLLDLGLAAAGKEMWLRQLRLREKVPIPLSDEAWKLPEMDTYAIGRLLVECLGPEALDEGSKLPTGLAETIRKAVDRSGLYLFRTARSLRREIAAYVDQGKWDRMRQELAQVAQLVGKEG